MGLLVLVFSAIQWGWLPVSSEDDFPVRTTFQWWQLSIEDDYPVRATFQWGQSKMFLECPEGSWDPKFPESWFMRLVTSARTLLRIPNSRNRRSCFRHFWSSNDPRPQSAGAKWEFIMIPTSTSIMTPTSSAAEYQYQYSYKVRVSKTNFLDRASIVACTSTGTSS